MTFALPIIPMGAALALLAARERFARLAPVTRRRALAGISVVTMAGLGAATACAIAGAPTATFGWGAGLALTLRIVPEVAVAVLLLPAVATPVIAWATAHEALDGLPRLVAGLLAFVGAMELLVLADDLLTLVIGWELVGAISYALIAHRWRHADAVDAAAYAYNATRLGGLGLIVAAGAALAATGSFSFASLAEAARTGWGPWIAAGVLFAAASKSAQLPFSPWLFRAMEGPSSVSALLHSSTMVAAGAWILVRLSAPLHAVGWLGPAAIAIGLATAFAGGVVAVMQPDAKKLLAASTSMHYGLMFVAAGAAAAGTAIAHLVMHALFKALLFLVAGAAIGAAGSHRLDRMGLGRALPWAAAASLVASLSLAGLPPLGGAWSKEHVVAAAGHLSPVLAVSTAVAAALGALYAARFHLLAFGRRDDASDAREPILARVAFVWLGLLVIVSSVAWWPGAGTALEGWLALSVPSGAPWELALSIGLVVVSLAAAYALHRRGALAALARPRAAEWLGLPRAIELGAIRPVLFLAHTAARFDERVVDAGVRAAARAGRMIAATAAFVFEGTVDAIAGAAGSGTRWLSAAAAFVFEGTVGRLAIRDARARPTARRRRDEAFVLPRRDRARLANEGVFGLLVDGLARMTTLASLQSRTADDDAIDGTVDRAARRVGQLGRDARRTQTGAVPTYYAVAVGGVAAAALLLALFGWIHR